MKEYRDVRLPSLPASFLDRWNREQGGKGKGGGLTDGTKGSILGGSEIISDEEKRRRFFAPYWAFWTSPEHLERCQPQNPIRRLTDG